MRRREPVRGSRSPRPLRAEPLAPASDPGIENPPVPVPVPPVPPVGGEPPAPPPAVPASIDGRGTQREVARSQRGVAAMHCESLVQQPVGASFLQV